MKRTLIALLAFLLAPAALAQAGSLVDVSVVNRSTGQTVPVWNHQGRLYAVGAPGERYSVVLWNRTGARVLAVVSVDGVNVISGETASPAQSGYVLDPFSRMDISGWRKNMGEVAAFYFTPQPDSYAARTQRPDQVGVIGVAVFREQPPPRPRPPAPIAPRSSAPSSDAAGPLRAEEAQAPMHDSAAASQLYRQPERRDRLGTGHGEREASAARWTQFRRASESPSEVVSIYYDTHANLAARGVIPNLAVPRPFEPSPFPGFRFTPDPRG
jgi:hypothetical protein